MNMVAASKFRTSQTRMESFRPYAMKFMEVLSSLAVRVSRMHTRSLQPEKQKNKSGLHELRQGTLWRI
jgi:F-type H+-transporting ATPase subunit gamma